MRGSLSLAGCIAMSKRTKMTHERLREVLHYDPSTGVFTRLVSRGRAKIGAVAGGINGHGYRRIMIDRKRYHAHRLAWFWMTGEWPAAEIDHWNLNRADNRWGNLRVATRSQNKANTRAYATNTSGLKGVSWDAQNSKWRAQIVINGKQISLGRRDTREEAAAEYADAAELYFGEFARAA